MTRRLPWLLLAVSVAFNIFGAIGFLKARSEAQAPAGFRARAELLARQLELTPPQRQRYDELIRQAEALRQARAAQREAFWQELIKDQPDRDALERYVLGPEADEQRLRRLEMLRSMIEVLTPPQREKLVQLLRRSEPASAPATAPSVGPA